MEKIPSELEKVTGLLAYGSKTQGIGGKIKKIPEDFIVEEICPDGRVLSVNDENKIDEQEKKDYVHFTLLKYNWDTMRALKEISKRVRVSRKRLGFAGTKDKRAITTQRVSIWKVPIEELMKVQIKDIGIRNPVYVDDRINLGELWGNRFTMTVREIPLSEDEIREQLNDTVQQLDGKIPDFFGLQRFGIQRPITHLVGKEILKKNFKEAVMIYLAKTFPEEGEEAGNARKILSETGDFREAIKNFPKYLGYERMMLDSLIHTPTDFIGALRKLPKKLRWMFIHAYQAYIFNRALSIYLLEGKEIDKLPLVGYESEVDDVTARIMDEEGIKKEEFLVKEMPEMSSKGEYRQTFVEFKDFEIAKIEKDELSETGNKAILKFSLIKGTYATVLLRELMKNEYW